MVEERQPAGWYPDPDPTATVRRQRWWDGRQWTQGTRLAPLPAATLTDDPAVVKRRRLVYVAAVVLVPVAIFGTMATNDEETARSSGGRDSIATMACYDALQLTEDADLLTDAEIRGRLQDIHDDAQYSDTPGIASASRRALAGATSGDGDAMLSAMKDFGRACAGGGPATTR